MKTIIAAELRNLTSAILKSVRKGNEVVITMRGKLIAIMKPVNEIEKPFNPVGFGMMEGPQGNDGCDAVDR